MQVQDLKEIPAPPGYPLIGNLLDLRDAEYPLQALERLANQYGEIFSLAQGGRKQYFTSSVKLLEELCDDKRFQKPGGGPSRSLPRSNTPPGLFSAPTDSKAWEVAHRVLMPAFGPLAIENLFDGMHDIAKQFILKWARAGPQEPLCATDDFTRLTLDTIGLCGMGTRFNSFYTDSQHPFVKAMNATLLEASLRTTRPALVTKILQTDKQAIANRQFQRDFGIELVKNRREEMRRTGSRYNDLLNHMLTGKDPKTGQLMDDELIGSNMTTFLVAGHETTSSLLSFALYNLLANPSAYVKAQKEVDSTLGTSPIKLEHLRKLPFLNAVLRETLRLFPTAPTFRRKSCETSADADDANVNLGGYRLPRGSGVTVLLASTQRDKEVYGLDAEFFKPERMLDDEFKKRPDAAWKPFGTGVRACIGRAFAWQEALLVLSLLLQQLDIRFDNPAYDLKIQFQLTMKPKNFYVHAQPRRNRDPITLERELSAITVTENATQDNELVARDPQKGGHNVSQITILFGGNTGTCEALAQRLANDVSKLGHTPNVDCLDSAAQGLPKNQPTIVITSSYEGQPPDNARRFVEGLYSSPNQAFQDTEYAVFGCGHHDWRSTFHRIPKLIDQTLADKGARRIAACGLTDVAEGTIFDDFDQWKDQHFIPNLRKVPNSLPDLPLPQFRVDLSTTKLPAQPICHTCEVDVLENTRLTFLGAPEKRHCAFALPERLSYATGDYLSISPKNDIGTVEQVISYFGIKDGTSMQVQSGGLSVVQAGQWLSVKDVLTDCVELHQPAALKDMRYLAEQTRSAGEKSELEDLIRLRADKKTPERSTTVVEILERYPSISISFTDFFALLSPLRARLYSISSSPLADPSVATTTFSVRSEDPSAPGAVSHRTGVCTSYLAKLNVGAKVNVSIKPGKQTFKLPALSEQMERPLIMICAGAGLAPFRGFIQERYEQLRIQPALSLRPAVVYVGCRSSTTDCLYRKELKNWCDSGAAQVKYAFSQEPGQSEGCAHVQDRLLQDRRVIETLWRQRARIYVCGSSTFATTVKQALKDIVGRALADTGKDTDEESVREKLKNLTEDRFVTDVFG